MRNTTATWSLSLCGAAILSLGLLTLGMVVRSQGPGAQDDQAFVEALRRGGLKEAARIKKHYVGTINTSQWLKFDLETLTKNSTAVIIGTPAGQTSQLTLSGEQITTTYQIRVEQSMKGAPLAGDTVNVILPGGKVVFEDGTSAEIKTPDLEQMQGGKRYVLFLTLRKESAGSFSLAGGGQGLFELTGDKSGVKPHGHQSDVVNKHKGETEEQFLTKVSAAVIKYPVPSSCCN